jgi:hypothetical protein
VSTGEEERQRSVFLDAVEDRKMFHRYRKSGRSSAVVLPAVRSIYGVFCHRVNIQNVLSPGQYTGCSVTGSIYRVFCHRVNIQGVLSPGQYTGCSVTGPIYRVFCHRVNIQGVLSPGQYTGRSVIRSIYRMFCHPINIQGVLSPDQYTGCSVTRSGNSYSIHFLYPISNRSTMYSII